jgi:NAD(P)H-dependent flavin oxidoreductase YrpB (nitropropane dioxygenase family)
VKLPKIIQGGMGVGVSSWSLARAVSRKGQIGVVSGVALDVVHARRLNDGDPGGHLRRAYERFVRPDVVERVLRRYYRPSGRPPGTRYSTVPEFRLDPPSALVDLTVLANFAEVSLAKEGHEGLVGINYLEKIQLPTLCSLYGAMLAGVDVVLMGAGIPKEIPRILDDLAAGRPATYRISVAGASPDDKWETRFDPAEFLGATRVTPLVRPRFLAIIASNTLAGFLAKSVGGRPDGFVVEGPTAGGHNAPPRGALVLDDAGQPVYGRRDDVDLDALAALGLPFWLAGGYGSPDRLNEALDTGAAGIQVGSAFALCEESSIDPSIKREIVTRALDGTLRLHTDPRSSPSGYPFKVAALDNTLSDPDVYASRTRVCDLGFLRTAYVSDDGTVGYRCPGEPVAAYVHKGGAREETEGRNCLCNGLLATVGLGQLRRGVPEPPIVTAGDDLKRAVCALAVDGATYSASDVVDYLLDAPRLCDEPG